MPKYNASRGGHAPGHLRDALCEWIDQVNMSEPSVKIPDSVAVGDNEDKHPIRWLLGQLWNCSDVLPSSYREQLRDLFDWETDPFTYGAAVRRIVTEL